LREHQGFTLKTNRERMIGATRVVVKIGTSALTNSSGRLDEKHLGRLATGLLDIAKRRQLLVVSSGAIALGVERLKLSKRPKDVPSKQACAAVGQSRLMQAWERALTPKVVGQVLLTHADVQNRKRYLNARHALETLLEHQVIPIINENDTVSVDEIKFGDNDALAGLVTGLVGADALVILSDVEGLFESDPRKNVKARLIREVTALDATIKSMAQGPANGLGTGGMATKIQAAELAMSSGAFCVIAPGNGEAVLQRIFAGEEVGTVFVPATQSQAARRRWIGKALRAKGRVAIDAGAAQALQHKKKSLLPAGIVSVEGRFQSGDAVDIVYLDHVVGRGLVSYSADELRAVQGRRTEEFEKLLGFRGAPEAVHRDNLVVWPASNAD
jgi:glutamate 5-kinase